MSSILNTNTLRRLNLCLIGLCNSSASSNPSPKLPLQDKLTAINNKIDELKQAETIDESLGKLRDAQTRILNVLDAITKSTELKDVLILLHQKPTVKRWLADEDVELDEADQRVINKLSSDKLRYCERIRKTRL